jgi:hypothetical protein
MGMRAAMRVFATGAEIPGFARVYDSPGAMVFEVKQMAPIPQNAAQPRVP